LIKLEPGSINEVGIVSSSSILWIPGQIIKIKEKPQASSAKHQARATLCHIDTRCSVRQFGHWHSDHDPI